MGAPEDQVKVYGEDLVLSVIAPTREGYTFVGWSTSVNGLVAYVAGANFTANCNTTLYAVWQINTYTVTYDANGGTGTPSPQTKVHDEMLTISSEIPVKEGYSFAGWSTVKDGEVEYISEAAYLSNASVLLYAVWVENIGIVASGVCGSNLNWTLYSDGELVIDGTGDMYDYKYNAYLSKCTSPWNAWKSSIKSVVVKDGVTSIGDYAFYWYHDALEKVEIAGTVNIIGAYSFYRCYSLTDLTIADGVIEIGSSAFQQCSFSTLTIPNSVTTINSMAFDFCDDLTDLSLGKGIKFIESSAFSLCSRLKRIWCSGSYADYSDSVLNNTTGPLSTATWYYENCLGVYQERTHTYSNWINHDDTQHKRTCECGDVVYADHFWDDGVVTNEPTHAMTGIMTHTCTVCGAEKTLVISKQAHEFGKWVSVSDTQHSRTCECGEIETTSHIWDDGEITTQPTHTTYGERTYTCKGCFATRKEQIAKSTVHDFGFWTKVDDETHGRTCTCGDIETVAHNWDAGTVTTQPTHLTLGVRTYTCKGCSATRTEQVAKTTEHSYGEWTKADNETHKRICACGDIETKSHNWDTGTVTTQPTHTVFGERTYTCEDCSATKAEQIAKITEHSYGSWIDQDNANHQRICACGSVETESHNWDNVTITVEPTHVNYGESRHTCSACGNTYYQTVDPLEHVPGEPVEIIVTPPTCTIEGERSIVIDCLTCGEIYSINYEQIPALGHTYTAVLVMMPTCTEDGVQIYTCEVCNDSYSQTISALGHVFENYVSNNDATYISDGTKTAICERCDASNTVVDADSKLYSIASGVCGSNLYWAINDEKELHIFGEGRMYSYRMHEAPWYDYRYGVRTIVIGEGVTAIDSYAFSEFEALYYVVLPSTITDIPAYAFAGCYHLVSITGTENLKFVSSSAFRLCQNLRSFTVSQSLKSIGSDAFYGCSSILDVYYDGSAKEWNAISIGDGNSQFTQATRHYSMFTITYNANGGTTECLEQKKVRDVDVSITDIHPTKTCHTFLGWAKTRNGDVQYLPGDIYSENADTTLYAIWEVRHTWGPTSIIPATCTADGMGISSCDLCGENRTEVIPATGHSYKTTITAPTCTEKGYTSYTCACGDSYIADEVAALGHSHEAVVTAPTCTEKGYTTYTCHCGDSYIADEVATTGHNYSTNVTAPTCTEKGYTTYTCTCGDSYVADQVGTLGHRYDTVTKDATCTANGSVTKICTACGDTQVDAIPATGHQIENGTCAVCGYTIGVTLSGSVTTGAEGNTIVELLSEGEVIATVNAVDTYKIENIVAGTYILRVSKESHVSHDYMVAVGSEAVIHDVKIHLIGDIDGNGKINVGDVAKMYAHVKKTSQITDEYILKCMDITGEGKINVGDTARLYAHVKKSSEL